MSVATKEDNSQLNTWIKDKDEEMSVMSQWQRRRDECRN